MKILISVLLGTLLFVESGHCLQCFLCAGVNDINFCNAKNCTEGQSTCVKTVLTSSYDSKTKVYVMDCTSSCEDYKNLLLESAYQGIDVKVSCCNTDLCNGEGGVKGNPWALAGTLLLSLGPALLWAGL